MFAEVPWFDKLFLHSTCLTSYSDISQAIVLQLHPCNVPYPQWDSSRSLSCILAVGILEVKIFSEKDLFLEIHFCCPDLLASRSHWKAALFTDQMLLKYRYKIDYQLNCLESITLSPCTEIQCKVTEAHTAHVALPMCRNGCFFPSMREYRREQLSMH